jgi:hypothetical protein
MQRITADLDDPEVRNKGSYKELDFAVREPLENYFELHNQRLYECLDVTFGW